jgi:hypothetical protein
MEKKPTRLLTNPPSVPKKKKKKKKRTRFEPVCVCVARRARANGQTMRKADVCVYRLAYSIRNFRHWLRLADTDKPLWALVGTNKQTNTQTNRITDTPRSLVHARGL